MNNKLVVFTGPSAVGKATIEHELFSDMGDKEIEQVIDRLDNPSVR